MILSDTQLQILRHMLGIDTPDIKNPKSYRNYFCANPNDHELAELATTGAVELYSKHSGYYWYQCTEAGTAAAYASHKKMLLPKKKRLYHRFLDVRDCRNDLTFIEYLTAPEYKESRDAA